MRLTFLGTGTSVGVPTIGCDCVVCRSDDARDKRFRASAMLDTATTRILIDCGPDFRMQMLGREFRRIDAVLITHIHYDHVGGLDDIRPFCRFGAINVYSDDCTADSLRHSMPYCFNDHLYPGVPLISLKTVKEGNSFMIGDVRVTPIRLMHGKMPILGYRLDDLLYITDMKTMDEDMFSYFRGVKTLVVNALRFSPDHHSHQMVSEAVAFARRVGAERTFFTHMCHDIGLHEQVNKVLPDGFQLAYDGQVVELPAPVV